MSIRYNQVDSARIQFDNPSDVLTPTPFSAMVWANPYSGGSNPANRTLMGIWDSPNDRSWRIFMVDGDTLSGRITFDGNAVQTITSSNSFALDTWHHLGIDFDGDDLNIWLDGVLDDTLSISGTIFSSGALELAIGGATDGGEIDAFAADARVYDRILSAEEWLTIFAARGHDGIVDGLLIRPIMNDRPIGDSVVPFNVKDQGPLQIPYDRSFGAPRPTYEEDPGLSFRKRA